MKNNLVVFMVVKTPSLQPAFGFECIDIRTQAETKMNPEIHNKFVKEQSHDDRYYILTNDTVKDIKSGENKILNLVSNNNRNFKEVFSFIADSEKEELVYNDLEGNPFPDMGLEQYLTIYRSEKRIV